MIIRSMKTLQRPVRAKAAMPTEERADPEATAELEEA